MKWKAVRYWAFVLGADALFAARNPHLAWWAYAAAGAAIWYLAGQIMERP